MATQVDLRRSGCQRTLPVVRTFSFAEKVGKENILVCPLTCSSMERHVDHQPTDGTCNPASGRGTYRPVLVLGALLPMTCSHLVDQSAVGNG